MSLSSSDADVVFITSRVAERSFDGVQKVSLNPVLQRIYFFISSRRAIHSTDILQGVMWLLLNGHGILQLHGGSSFFMYHRAYADCEKYARRLGKRVGREKKTTECRRTLEVCHLITVALPDAVCDKTACDLHRTENTLPSLLSFLVSCRMGAWLVQELQFRNRFMGRTRRSVLTGKPRRRWRFESPSPKYLIETSTSPYRPVIPSFQEFVAVIPTVQSTCQLVREG